jgi:hypothetical protein
MRLFYFFLLSMLLGCDNDNTKRAATSAPDEIDIRTYYALDKLNGSDKVYCYRDENSGKPEYIRMFLPKNGDEIFVTHYDGFYRKTFEAGRYLHSDYMEMKGFGTYEYEGRNRILTSWIYQEAIPFTVNLKDNGITALLSTDDHDLGLEGVVESYFTKVTDTVGCSGYDREDCLKLIGVTNIVKCNREDLKNIKIKDFEIYAKGVGLVYYTNNNFNEAYRLDRIMDHSEFEKMVEKDNKAFDKSIAEYEETMKKYGKYLRLKPPQKK